MNKALYNKFYRIIDFKIIINKHHEGQILNTSTDVDYDIYVVCIFSTDETISIHDMKRQIHVDLKLLPRNFNISISV
jgi:hypothetical protein